MSTRALSPRSTLGVGLAVAAAAFVSLSCGGGAGPEAVTGPEATPARAGADEDALVSTSEAPEFVDVCHYDAVTPTYSKLRVPAPALEPHLNHGDFEKPDPDYDCAEGPPPTADCPCFDAGAVDTAAVVCSSFDALCTADDYTALCLDDNGGGENLLAMTLGEPFRCVFPTWSSEVKPLSAAEYDACLDELDKSAFVTEGPESCG